MAKQIVEMLVESATMELPDTKTLKLQWPEGYQVDFKTGQFITLYFPDAPAYKRAYSLSSCALDRGFYEVTVKRDGIEGKGGTWSAEQEEAFKQPIREQYEHQGHPYYASARLWDDGVIDPAQTRDVLGLGLSATMNAPIEDTRFGVFRM